MMKFLKKHWEVLSYLIFGVLTTLLNILLYALFSRLFGYTAANSWGNVLDNALCILFAYCTNRAFVFRSKTTGKAMAKEFGTFVTCRLGTMVLDAAIMIVGGNLLAAQGAALVDTAMQGLLGAVAGWLGPDSTLHGKQLCREPCRRGRRLRCHCRHRRGGRPHSHFRHQRLRCSGNVGPCREGLFQCTGDLAELCVQQAHYL